MLRALAYIQTHGYDGLREATEAAVLNARYIAHGLTSDYDKPFNAPPMHEVVFTDKRQTRKGIAHARHRQATDRLRLSPDDDLLSADCSGRDVDRANRIGGSPGIDQFIEANASDRA